MNGTDDTYDIDFCKTGDDSTACSDPDVMLASNAGTLTVQLDEAGTYNFRCDFHALEMLGTLVVQ